MIILGLNMFHPDASACLLIDGELVGAVAEERLGSRQKHTSGFPIEAIRWLFQANGVRLKDVGYVAVARSPYSNLGAKFSQIVANPTLGVSRIPNVYRRNKGQANSLTDLSYFLGESPNCARFKIVNVEHHIAHVASSYYVSPFESKTAAFSYDGSGDFVSTLSAVCEGTKIRPIKKVFVPNSLGHFYTAMCQFIGFDRFGEEYKVMGLAPYGNDNYSHIFDKFLSSDKNGKFILNKTYFDVSSSLNNSRISEKYDFNLGPIYTKEMEKIFGPARERTDPISKREMDIAKSTQVKFEAVASDCLSALNEKVSLNQVVLAGGCALNGVMNARILRDFPVERSYIQPAASDDGTAIGAAYYCWHEVLGRTERFEMTHAFWGPEYTDSEILSSLEDSALSPFVCKSQFEAAEIASDFIANGQVVGWYQGRSEWGPRALGNRSILANPAIPDMKNTINQKIKKRESFRPFAPSVLQEDVDTYFEQSVTSPFMMHVIKFKPKWHDVLPSVVHADGTGRVQTVSKEQNALYHHLISCVKSYTGHGMVLNTSFNENEPIVDTPRQAIDCFLRTDMDALILGRYIVSKRD